MQLVPHSQARTTASLKLRTGPSTKHSVKAGIKAGVLVNVLAAPVNNWVEVEVNGYSTATDPNTIYSEPDASSSVEATRGGTVEWRQVALTGFVHTSYLTIIDGPV
jgi:uncharacterized protein YgiM (DUF1202 family)